MYILEYNTIMIIFMIIILPLELYIGIVLELYIGIVESSFGLC